MTLEDIFKFGRHEGQQLEDVIEDDLRYIEWCCTNEIVDFDDEAIELIAKKGIA